MKKSSLILVFRFVFCITERKLQHGCCRISRWLLWLLPLLCGYLWILETFSFTTTVLCSSTATSDHSFALSLIHPHPESSARSSLSHCPFLPLTVWAAVAWPCRLACGDSGRGCLIARRRLAGGGDGGHAGASEAAVAAAADGGTAAVLDVAAAREAAVAVVGAVSLPGPAGRQRQQQSTPPPHRGRGERDVGWSGVGALTRR